MSETIQNRKDNDSDFESLFNSPSAPLPPPPVLRDTLTSPNRQLSQNSKQHLGKKVPTNTKKNNLPALHALCKCICEMAKYSGSDILEYGRVYIFSDENRCLMPKQNTSWSDDHLKNIRDILIEFVANFKNRKTGRNVMPTTLNNYILGMQRGMEMEWGYKLRLLTGPTFLVPRMD